MAHFEKNAGTEAKQPNKQLAWPSGTDRSLNLLKTFTPYLNEVKEQTSSHDRVLMSVKYRGGVCQHWSAVYVAMADALGSLMKHKFKAIVVMSENHAWVRVAHGD